MNVRDKVCVVTGGAQGIGLALCTRFAREGALEVIDAGQFIWEEAPAEYASVVLDSITGSRP